MKNKEMIKQEVEKTMRYLGSMDKLPPNPYFYTRVQARLKSSLPEASGREGVILSRFWRPALIGIIIVLNLTTALLVFLGDGVSREVSQDISTVLATEYGLTQEDIDLFASNE